MSGGFIERLQTSPRLQRRIFRASLVVLFLGVVAAIFALTWRAPAKETAAHGEAVNALAAQTPVGVDPEARAVATRWILGAVTRDNLADAFALTHSDLRGGMSRAEWLSGNIPVIPYPVEQAGISEYKVTYSFPRELLMEVRLIPRPGAPADTKPLTFYIGLAKVGAGAEARWVVNYWVPRFKPPLRLFNP